MFRRAFFRGLHRCPQFNTASAARITAVTQGQAFTTTPPWFFSRGADDGQSLGTISSVSPSGSGSTPQHGKRLAPKDQSSAPSPSAPPLDALQAHCTCAVFSEPTADLRAVAKHVLGSDNPDCRVILRNDSESRWAQPLTTLKPGFGPGFYQWALSAYHSLRAVFSLRDLSMFSDAKADFEVNPTLESATKVVEVLLNEGPHWIAVQNTNEASRRMLEKAPVAYSGRKFYELADKQLMESAISDKHESKAYPSEMLPTADRDGARSPIDPVYVVCGESGSGKTHYCLHSLPCPGAVIGFYLTPRDGRPELSFLQEKWPAEKKKEHEKCIVEHISGLIQKCIDKVFEGRSEFGDPSSVIFKGASMLLVIDEVGGYAGFTRRFLAAREAFRDAWSTRFPGRVVLAVCGTGVEQAPLAPGTLPNSYRTVRLDPLTPNGKIALLRTLASPTLDIRPLDGLLTTDPLLSAITENARCLKRMTLCTEFHGEWWHWLKGSPSPPLEVTVAFLRMFVASAYKSENGLKDRTSAEIDRSTVAALQSVFFQVKPRFSGASSMVQDNARRVSASAFNSLEEDVIPRTDDTSTDPKTFLVLTTGLRRYGMSPAMFVMCGLRFGVVAPQTTPSGVEQSGVLMLQAVLTALRYRTTTLQELVNCLGCSVELPAEAEPERQIKLDRNEQVAVLKLHHHLYKGHRNNSMLVSLLKGSEDGDLSGDQEEYLEADADPTENQKEYLKKEYKKEYLNALASSTGLPADPKAMMEKLRRPLIVLVPADQSPSADIVGIIRGHAVVLLQCKCYKKTTLTMRTVLAELYKMGVKPNTATEGWKQQPLGVLDRWKWTHTAEKYRQQDLVAVDIPKTVPNESQPKLEANEVPCYGAALSEISGAVNAPKKIVVFLTNDRASSVDVSGVALEEASSNLGPFSLVTSPVGLPKPG